LPKNASEAGEEGIEVMKTIVIETTPCPSCGKPMPAGLRRAEAASAAPAGALDGLCPACLLKMGAQVDTVTDAKQPAFNPPSVSELAPLFPQLEILELIGKGGMGAVYKARQPKLDRLVALKILSRKRDSGLPDAEFTQRFEREARALARLSHPDIVAVYDFGEAGGFHFLLMEFVDGLTLRQLLQTQKLSPEQALTIVPKICEALQFAHERGIVHRDIKPENILLDARGRVKIADFGIAKLVGDRPGDVTLTASGARLGTPHYMAPEQVEKPSDVDHRADIYSLGVVFYELLTGELPLGRFAPPSAKADLDARVDEIVLRALAKERELRQQSAGEVKTQVEGLSTPPPILPPPAAPRGVPRDFEYKSPRTLFGLPLVHVVSGWDPKTGRTREARGILAVGPRALGWFAVGGQARGILAFGGVAAGLFAFGGIAVGGLAIGGLAAGFFSFGGLALALLVASGGIAVGWEAFGGIAVGNRALGGLTVSNVPISLAGGWRRQLLGWTPWLWVPTMLLSAVPMMVTLWVVRLQRRLAEPRPRPKAELPGWVNRAAWLFLLTGGIALVPTLLSLGSPMRLYHSGCLLALTGVALLTRGRRWRAVALVVNWGAIGLGLFSLCRISLLAMTGPALGNGAYLANFFGLAQLAGFAAGIWILGHRDVRPSFGCVLTQLSEPAPNPWPHRLFWLVVSLLVLPASAMVAGLIAPVLFRASGGFGGILAGLLPMAAGALLVWLFLKTGPSAAQAKPRDQWNPWPKRIFMAVLLLVILPACLLVVGLIVPRLMTRRVAPTVAPVMFAHIERSVERVSESDLLFIWRVVSPTDGSLTVEMGTGRETAKLVATEEGKPFEGEA
ncbi:MAG TPA: hypothetical protein DCE44_07840, partial [Verrucomicrobiales bacterium]|nr:hypothetical protein [Verrucomicrobiales bacterium]